MACPPGCFPPTAQVLTTNGYIPVKGLTRNQKLLAFGCKKDVDMLKETDFYTYIHSDANLIADYLVITCDNGAQLVISESHLMFRTVANGKQSKAVQASALPLGDSLIHVDDKGNMTFPVVTEISKKVIRCVYAPMSGSGTLIVDGFKTSCYAEVESHSMAHRAMAPLRTWLRIKGDPVGKSKEMEVSENGIHDYAKFLHSLRSVSTLF